MHINSKLFAVKLYLHNVWCEFVYLLSKMSFAKVCKEEASINYQYLQGMTEDSPT